VVRLALLTSDLACSRVYTGAQSVRFAVAREWARFRGLRWTSPGRPRGRPGV